MINIKLSEPIEVEGREVLELNIRKAKGKDYRKLKKMDFDATYSVILDFAAILADIPPAAMDEMCSEDIQKICKTVGPLLVN